MFSPSGVWLFSLFFDSMILLADVCLVLTNLIAFLYFMAFSAERLIVFVEYDWLLLFIEL